MEPPALMKASKDALRLRKKYSTDGELHCSLAKASYHTKDIRFAQEYIDNK